MEKGVGGDINPRNQLKWMKSNHLVFKLLQQGELGMRKSMASMDKEVRIYGKRGDCWPPTLGFVVAIGVIHLSCEKYVMEENLQTTASLESEQRPEENIQWKGWGHRIFWYEADSLAVIIGLRELGEVSNHKMIRIMGMIHYRRSFSIGIGLM